MSDNESRKRAAREFQAANPGTSYTRALRQVAKKRIRRPLTAVLGVGVGGRPVELNLDWQVHGGSGPHCTVAGEQVSSLLAVLATGLAAGQSPGDLELMVCVDEDTQVTVAHRRVGAGELAAVVDELLASRFEFFRSVDALDIEDARGRGHQVPTTVVLIDDHDGALAGSEVLARWLRVGRSAGIDLVVGMPIARPNAVTSTDGMSPAEAFDRLVRAATRRNRLLDSMASATVVDRGQGHWMLRTSDRWGRSVLTDFTLGAGV
ncbi:hypothetical protein [Mycolicibacterium palauense]|uniref:hypothetical protein n=1 Tax=Mycolicibacterium palauense TaxID=2034511 RepID=UPI000BFEC220|nr:hypothetical protein [Mycolicibacterium palauense]